MRRLILVSILGLFLLPGIAFSQEPGYAYEKPSLKILIPEGQNDFRTKLTDLLLISLSAKYNLRFADTEQSARGVVITSVSAKKEQIGSSVSYEINATARIIGGTGKFSASNVHGFEIKDNEFLAYDAALKGLAKEVSDAIIVNFPLEANIRSRDGNLIYIDRSIQAGFAPGMYGDVYDENNEHIGIIRIVRASENQSIAKIVRGKNRIDVGNSVRTRHFVDKYGFALEAFHVPVSSGFGDVYKQVTGDSTSAGELTDAYMATVSLIWDWTNAGSQVGLCAGMIHMHDYNHLLFQAYVSPAVSVIFDRLSLSALLGGGVFFIEGQPYARPAGSYTDGLADSGETDGNAQWFIRAQPGLRLYLTPSFSISLFGGYFYAGKGDDWSIRVGEGDKAETKDLESKWVRYDNIEVSGFSFGFALSFSGSAL